MGGYVLGNVIVLLPNPHSIRNGRKLIGFKGELRQMAKNRNVSIQRSARGYSHGFKFNPFLFLPKKCT